MSRSDRPSQARPIIEALEAKLLYAGDFAPAAFLSANLSATQINPALHHTQAPSSELVFIDASVPDVGLLLDDITRQNQQGRPITAILIQADEDGLARISEVLSQQHDISAIHLIGHGEAGDMHLGTATLDTAALLQHAPDIASWATALSSEADILLYGCDVAASEQGQQLVHNLAMITGADVAASDDLTGNSRLGGDWLLEVQDGVIDTRSVLSVTAQAQWDGVLLLATPSDKGTAIWTETGFSTPQTAAWDGLTLGSQGNTTASSNWQVITSAASPTRDEALVVGVDANGVIRGQRWDGTQWTVLPMDPLASGTTTDRQGFAVAYEQISGDAMLVWNNGSTLSYSTFNGTSWSAAQTVTAYTGATPSRMQIATRASGDQMALVISDINADDRALIWNGNTWGNAITLDITGTNSDDQMPIGVAFESVSGRVMAAYTKGTSSNTNSFNGNLYYRMFDGTSWGLEGQAGNYSENATPYGLSITSDPHSNRIAFGLVSAASGSFFSINSYNSFAIWSGSAWSARAAWMSNNVGPQSSMGPTVAVGFESQSGDALGVFGDASNSLQYTTWNHSTSTWSSLQTNSAIGGRAQAIRLFSDPTTDHLMLGVNTTGSVLTFTDWSGSAWGAPATVATDTGLKWTPGFTWLWQNPHLSSSASANDLWLGSSQNSTAWPGVNAVSNTEVLSFNGTNLHYGSSTTGSFSHLFDLGAFGASGLDDIAWVSQDVALATNLTVHRGDVLFTVNNTCTLTSTGGATVSANNNDVILFRPTVAGDYSKGSFVKIIQGMTDGLLGLGTGPDVRGLALVEQDVVMGDVTLRAGQFLLSVGNGSNGQDVYLYAPSNGPLVSGLLSGGMSTLITGSDIGINKVVTGLEVISTVTTLKNATLPAGSLLMSFEQGTSVGSTPISVDSRDIVLLKPTMTSANGNTAQGIAEVLFTGSSAGLGSGESFDTLALHREMPPTITSSAVVSVSENTSAVVTTVTATDPDANTVLSYRLAGGADGNLFSIDATTGQLRFQSPPDYERPLDTNLNNVYEVTVAVSDGDLEALQSMDVTVANVDEAPAIDSNGGDTTGSISLLEGQTAVTMVHALDPESDSITYTMTGVDAGNFNIDASSGQLTFKTATNALAPTDANQDNLYDVNVIASAGGQSDTQNLQITVQAINRPPTNILPGNFTLIEDSAISVSGIRVIDLDAGSADITVTFSVQYGTLLVNATATGGLNASQITYSPDQRQVQLRGSQGAINTTLASTQALTYRPDANYHGSDTLVMVSDDLGNSGVGLAPSVTTDTDSASLNITSRNDAPLGANKTIATLEDTAYVFSANDFGFSDPSDSNDNTLLAVKLTTLSSAGSLRLNGQLATTGQLVNVNDINNGLLSFVPMAHANGSNYTSFTFQVQDNGGRADGGQDLCVSPNTITVDVMPVNDAPAATDKAITTLEDTTYVFVATDFGFTDVADAGAYNLLAIHVTTLPQTGSLQLGSQAVTVNQVVSISDINNGLLSFAPDANTNGSSYASFSFLVQDDGGSANGGSDLSFTPNTITVDVTAVNDAPTAADKNLSTLEDTPYVLSAADFGFNDSVDANAHSLQSVHVIALPTAGSLTLGGLAVVANQVVSLADINSGQLSFAPDAEASGNGYASFTFLVQDSGGTADGGLDLSATPNTITFDVTAVNDAPAAADKTLTTLEDTPYIFNATDFGFSDTKDGSAHSLLAIHIATLPAAGAMLLGGQAVSASQVVSISDINSGLLSFAPAPNGNGSNYTSFTFQVQDDGGLADGGQDISPTPNTLTISVTAVNDAPTAANQAVTTIEDRPYVFTATDFGFSDAADGSMHNLLAIHLTTLPATGTLQLGGQDVTINQIVSVSDIDNGQLVFTPTANAHGSPVASFSFQVQDDGGTAHGGQDLSITLDTIIVTVTPVNDAPSAADKTLSTLEDRPYVFAATDFGFSDAADGSAHSLLAVHITSLPTAGSLQLAGQALTLNQAVSASDINDGLLRFVPQANANGLGYASFSFQVQDNGGVADGGQDMAVASNTITLDVTAVNDAPAAADKTITTLEDKPYVFTATDFGFSDAADGSTHSLQAIHIATLPSAGTLQLSGQALTANQVVSINDIDSGLLRFVPEADANGLGYASFTFQVQDNGGTAHGGQDLSVTPGTITVTVTLVNDAPAASDNTLTTLEDTPYVFAATDFGFIDTADGSVNVLLAVHITSLPTAGTLQLAGQAVMANQVVSVNDIDNGLLSFSPASDANGIGYASFTFQVQDDGGVADGGQDLSLAPNTLTLDVVPVNDAPAAADKTLTTLEDTPYVFVVNDFGFSDTVDGSAHQLQAVHIKTLPATGSLHIAGQAVVINQVVSISDISSGLLSFIPETNVNGMNYASFTFRVEDSGGSANGGQDLSATPYTITIDVTAVSDAPTAADRTLTTAEDSTYVFTSDDFGFNDAADGSTHNLQAIHITTLPAAGSLQLAGQAVTTNQIVSISDINSGLLSFTPEADTNGGPYASFSFLVQDSGGDANGGQDLSVIPNTLTINVTPVNDAPTATGSSSLIYDENAGAVLVGSGITINDIDSSQLAGATTRIASGYTSGEDSLSFTSQYGISGTWHPDTGELILSGSASVEQYQSVLNSVTYTNISDTPSTASRTLAFTVNDGNAESPISAATQTITVVAINDAPQVTQNSLTIQPGGRATPTIMVSDPEDAPDHITFTVQTVFGGQFIDKATGNAVQTFTAAQLVNGTILFVHDGVSSDPGYQLIVSDGTASHPVQNPVVTLIRQPLPLTDTQIDDTPSPESKSSPDKQTSAKPVENASTERSPAKTDDGQGVQRAPIDLARNLSSAPTAQDITIAAPTQRFQVDAGYRATKDINSIAVNTDGFQYRWTGSLQSGSASEELNRNLNALREQLTNTDKGRQQLMASSIALTTGLSMGYVIWLIRGGALLGSMLSSMPLWNMIDPLPVLNRVGARGARNDDAEGDASLEKLFDTERPDRTPPPLNHPPQAISLTRRHRHEATGHALLPGHGALVHAGHTGLGSILSRADCRPRGTQAQ
jgi:hypothetical protein